MKKRYSLITLVAIFILSISSVHAQKSEKEIITEFFKIFKNSPGEAMDYAFSTNPWMKRNKDATDNIKNQFNTVLPLVGNYQGYELINEKTTGKSLKLLSYMVRFDRQPFRFTFIFYKPDAIWQVQNLKYDDNLDDELEKL